MRGSSALTRLVELAAHLPRPVQGREEELLVFLVELEKAGLAIVPLEEIQRHLVEAGEPRLAFERESIGIGR